MTAPVKLMILEDKRFLAEDLVDRLSDYELMGPFASGEEALEAAEDELPTVGVFDIELKGELNGIDVAERINKTKVIPIIYLTKIQDDQSIFERISSAEFPVFFVSKPVSNTELKINLNNAFKALENLSGNELPEEEGSPMDVLSDRVLLRSNTGVQSVDIKDLVFLEADGDTTKVYAATQAHPIVVSTHLKGFMEKLSAMSKDMLRVSRSNAVNIRKIIEIKDDFRNLSAKKTLILKDTDETVSLSPIYKKELMARFKMI
ncbi:MAG: LytTR family transcriptional regulator [Roseivirga sp.]|nr:LytTR family transcriptional regulator [Roseivirga sp.]